jgi:hypothetical protein
MTKPTIHQLLAAATKGPYYVSHDEKDMDSDGYRAHVASGLAVVDTGREQDWPIARFCEWPQAHLIARLHPGTVARIVEALEEAGSWLKELEDEGDAAGWVIEKHAETCAKITASLALLNGSEE